MKKCGLGATKVKTNFAQVEKEAESIEESHSKILADSVTVPTLPDKEKEDSAVLARLAYNDSSNNKHKVEHQSYKSIEKTAQAQRLGMGMPLRM